MKTVLELLGEYDDKRMRAIAISEGLIKNYYETNPKAQRQKRQRDDILLESLLLPAAKGFSVGPTGTVDIESIKRKAKEKLDTLEDSEDLSRFAPKFECDTCNDTGYVEGAVGQEFCDCLLNKIYIEVYGGIDTRSVPSFEDYNLNIFTGEHRSRMSALKDMLLRCADEFPSNRVNTMLLNGAAGLGKTFALNCFASEVAKKSNRVLLIGANALFDVFHKHRLGQISFIEPIFLAEVLLIDDLGTEPMTQNVTVENLFRLLNERPAKGLTTMITTNLTTLEIKQRYSEKVLSRLASSNNGAILRVSGVDVRTQPASKKEG